MPVTTTPPTMRATGADVSKNLPSRIRQVAKETSTDELTPKSDSQVEHSEPFEFGGSFGVGALSIGFPLLMWFMWIGATYYDGQIPRPMEGQTLAEFGNHLVQLVLEGAFPNAKAWIIYWSFFLVEALFYCFMPGVWGYGKPLLHEGGKQLPYYCSAYVSFYATMFIAGCLHFTGIFPLDTLLDEFGPIMSVAILSGFINSIIVYVAAFIRGRTHRLTGQPVYDFFMGAELNPRIGVLDFKMFYEVRIPWFILFLISCSVAARQYRIYGYVSGEVLFLVMAHFLYANAVAKGEQLIITSWDMYFEKLGFMLTFWNMAGVPFSYCHCALYFANRDPAETRWNPYALTALFISYLFVYWVWDTANSQKNGFRQMERGQLIQRKTFPQLPWRTIENPKTIPTQTEDSILADGWFGISRKPHYPCDAYFAICWGLITGFRSPFPWFYPVFFVIMIIHRTQRDVMKCREKYGKAWEQYEREVPYLFIPYVF